MNRNQKRMGEALKNMIDSIEVYFEAFEANTGIIGDDGYACVDAADLLKSCQGLLNCERGEQDGGTLDRRIRDIAKRHGLLDDNGEIA